MTIPPGIYRLYWKSGGSSIAAVGQLWNGKAWYAPINWVGVDPSVIVGSDWSLILWVAPLSLEPRQPPFRPTFEATGTNESLANSESREE